MSLNMGTFFGFIEYCTSCVQVLRSSNASLLPYVSLSLAFHSSYICSKLPKVLVNEQRKLQVADNISENYGPTFLAMYDRTTVKTDMYRQYYSHSVAQEFTRTRSSMAHTEVLVSAAYSYLAVLNKRKGNRTLPEPYLNKREALPNLNKELVFDKYLLKKKTL